MTTTRTPAPAPAPDAAHIAAEKDAYIVRMNAYNDDLRRRNGELFDALHDAAPATAALFTPPTGIESRYLRIMRLVNAGARVSVLIEGTDDTQPITAQLDAARLDDLDDALRDIADASTHLDRYWRDVEEVRAHGAERAAKAQVTRYGQ